MQADKATVVSEVNKYGHKLDCNCDACLTSDSCRSMRDGIPMTEFHLDPDAMKDAPDKTKAGVSKVMGTIDDDPDAQCTVCGWAGKRSQTRESWLHVGPGSYRACPRCTSNAKPVIRGIVDDNKPLPPEAATCEGMGGKIFDSYDEMMAHHQSEIDKRNKARMEKKSGYSLTMTRNGTTITATAESMNECWILFKAALDTAKPDATLDWFNSNKNPFPAPCLYKEYGNTYHWAKKVVVEDKTEIQVGWRCICDVEQVDVFEFFTQSNPVGFGLKCRGCNREASFSFAKINSFTEAPHEQPQPPNSK